MPKIQGFHYDGLTETTVRKAARDAAKAIKANLKKATTAIVEIGKRLWIVRDQLSDEEWKAWLEAEFKWSQAQASNYMRSSQQFGELTCLDQFQPTALFALCRSKVSEEAVAEAVSKAESGEIVTHKMAQEIIAKYQPEPTRTVTPVEDPASPESASAPGNAETVGAAVDVVESSDDVFASIDQFCERVDDFASKLNRDEREELADRFLELAMQLGAAAKAEQPAKPKRTRSAKRSKTTKAA